MNFIISLKKIVCLYICINNKYLKHNVNNIFPNYKNSIKMIYLKFVLKRCHVKYVWLD